MSSHGAMRSWFPQDGGVFLCTSCCRVTLVNLRNRTGEERRRQTLCDKRDNNFV